MGRVYPNWDTMYRRRWRVVALAAGAIAMQRDFGTTAAEYSPVSRRQAIIGVGTLATAGVGLSTVGTGGARAQVSVESFDVADATFTDDQADPKLAATVAYDYDVGVEPVADLRFELLVGDSVIASDELTTSTTALAGDTTLSGMVTDSDAWSVSDFAPEVASSVSRDLSVTVRFAVLDSSDAVIVEDTASDTATVTVSHPQESKLIASVGGSGEFSNANQ